MAGTILITGANGSLGLGFVQSLLASYPECTLIATVRNTSGQHDPNTAKLLRFVSKHPKATVQIEALDLSSLASVRSFADRISTDVSKGNLPCISAIVCNAFTWSLNGQTTTAPDGYETTFQVCHLSHMLLVLKLLGSVNTTTGRVVMLGSTAHDPEKENPLSKLRAGFTDDMDLLVHPTPDEPGQAHDRGFQRYGTAKLANVVLMHDLNMKLQADANLSTITVTCMDPGGLVGSRAHSEQRAGVRRVFSVLNGMMPLLKHLTSALRTTEDAGRDLVALSVGPEFQGKRGYFLGKLEAESAHISRDSEVQQRLWEACWRWARVSEGESVLGG